MWKMSHSQRQFLAMMLAFKFVSINNVIEVAQDMHAVRCHKIKLFSNGSGCRKIMLVALYRKNGQGSDPGSGSDQGEMR